MKTALAIFIAVAGVFSFGGSPVYAQENFDAGSAAQIQQIQANTAPPAAGTGAGAPASGGSAQNPAANQTQTLNDLNDISCGGSNTWFSKLIGAVANPACGLLIGVFYLIDGLGYILISAVEGLFNAVIQLSTRDEIWKSGGIAVAWSITRDTANLFFIIILIISALATIFDLDQFNVKSVLPRLIVIALLINFSLLIGTFIIGQANVLGNVFLERARVPTSLTWLAGSDRSLSAAIQEMITIKSKGVEWELRGLTKKDKNGKSILDGTERTDAERLQKVEAATKTEARVYELYQYENKPASLSAGSKVTVTAAECGSQAPPVLRNSFACGDWRKALSSTAFGQSSDPMARLGLAIMAKLLVYPIAIFVMLAGSFLLIGRIIALSFILVLGPLAFLSFLVPGRQQHWSEWWSKLFTYAFFYPAFMFCFMASILIFGGLAETKMFASQILLSYVIGIGFMLGSIIVAQKMSVAGAGTVTKYGNKLTGSMKGWAATKAANVGWRVGGGLARGTLDMVGAPVSKALDKTIGRIPIIGKALAEAPLRPLTAIAGRKKKLEDESEKARIDRLAAAADTNPEYAAARWGASQDKEEAVKSMKPSKLKKLLEKTDAAKLRETYLTTLKDPKDKEKFLAAITDLGKRVEVQTGVKMSSAEELNAITDSNARRQKIEDEGRAMARTLANMPREEVQKITAEQMKTNEQLRQGVFFLAANTNFLRNIGNDENKMEELQDILIKKSGVAGITRDNLKETQAITFTLRDESDNVLAPSASISAAVENVYGDITLNPGERVDKLARELANMRNAGGGVFKKREIEGRYAPGTAEYDQAYGRYFKREAVQLLASRESPPTNLDAVIAGLPRQIADAINSSPSIRNSLETGAPMSAKSEKFVIADEGTIAGATPP